jgi:polyphosphate kinase
LASARGPHDHPANEALDDRTPLLERLKFLAIFSSNLDEWFMKRADESFDASVTRFIRAAADDPKVQALKMTVYRIGSDTPFIDDLIRAAEWLDRVGVHVIYGVMGFKTHAKAALAVRRDDDGLRCYAHVGTGNYHVKTARLWR